MQRPTATARIRASAAKVLWYIPGRSVTGRNWQAQRTNSSSPARPRLAHVPPRTAPLPNTKNAPPRQRTQRPLLRHPSPALARSSVRAPTIIPRCIRPARGKDTRCERWEARGRWERESPRAWFPSTRRAPWGMTRARRRRRVKDPRTEGTRGPRPRGLPPGLVLALALARPRAP